MRPSPRLSPVRQFVLISLVGLMPAVVLAQPPAAAPAAPAPDYGAPIAIESAKKAAAAAIAEAKKNNWTMAIAIVDGGGNLVYFEKMDGTQIGSVRVAQDKARSSALFKRPTKAFQDGVAGGGAGLRLLKLEGGMPIEGGVPLIMGGKIVGAIGVSGGSSEQDGVCALAAAAVLK
jgi:glc operon protein GlcG